MEGAVIRAEEYESERERRQTRAPYWTISERVEEGERIAIRRAIVTQRLEA